MFKTFNGDCELGDFDTIAGAFRAIDANLKKRNIDNHYTRIWYENDLHEIVIDYGSWSDFYYIKNVQWVEFEKWLGDTYNERKAKNQN